jgi:hypothetical protein
MLRVTAMEGEKVRPDKFSGLDDSDLCLSVME